MSSIPKYLIIKGCAGLGNRLVTLFSAIKYCEKNNRIVVIDWRDGQFDKKGIDAFKKCFDISHVIVDDIENIKDYSRLTHTSELFHNHQQEGVYDLYLDKQSAFWMSLPAKLFVSENLKKLRRRWQPILKGNYYNSLNFGNDLNDNHKEQVLYYVDSLPFIDYSELPNYIQLKPFLEKEVNQFSDDHNITNAIGVHIRHTDKRPTAEVNKVIRHVKLNHSNTPVYLSTDSTEVEELFLDEISGTILCPKIKPKLNGEGLHQWALYNNQEDLKYSLYKESVIELFLLSKCKYLYYQGNSTFSNVSKVYHVNKNNCYDWLQL